MHDIESIMAQAEQRWGIQLKRKTANEACGPCPHCSMATDDGFLVFEDGGYWCRKCDAKGWIDDNKRTSPAEQRLRRIEWKQRRADIERRELGNRITALETMAQQAGLVDLYHANLTTNERAVDHWHDHYGVSYQTINSLKLGYCARCPTAQFSDSLTIPVWYQNKLLNIRHRLLNPDNTGRYRPHMANLGATLYNADDLHADSNKLMILEGEIKSVVVSQETGLANVAVIGKSGFPAKWACDKRFERFKTIYVCYDPDATEQAVATAKLFGDRARVMTLPTKADDYFTRAGGTAKQFTRYIQTARRVQ